MSFATRGHDVANVTHASGSVPPSWTVQRLGPIRTAYNKTAYCAILEEKLRSVHVRRNKQRTMDSRRQTFPQFQHRNDGFGLSTESYLSRSLNRNDFRLLLPRVGPLVDELYPRGTEKLVARLEASLNYRSEAFVAFDWRWPRLPLALASEKSKGKATLKLCTFWVDPRMRRRGVGRFLLAERVSDWLDRDVTSVHVTVRAQRARPLEALFGQLGFRRIAVDLGRYGQAQDEVILQWRPEWSPLGHSASLQAAQPIAHAASA
jgi:GNAT superfamily N-acetyltransferase